MDRIGAPIIRTVSMSLITCVKFIYPFPNRIYATPDATVDIVTV